VVLGRVEAQHALILRIIGVGRGCRRGHAQLSLHLHQPQPIALQPPRVALHAPTPCLLPCESPTTTRGYLLPAGTRNTARFLFKVTPLQALVSAHQLHQHLEWFNDSAPELSTGAALAAGRLQHTGCRPASASPARTRCGTPQTGPARGSFEQEAACLPRGGPPSGPRHRAHGQVVLHHQRPNLRAGGSVRWRGRALALGCFPAGGHATTPRVLHPAWGVATRNSSVSSWSSRASVRHEEAWGGVGTLVAAGSGHAAGV
jgi:hypothetical protein